MIRQEELRHFSMFCGLGGGSKGFNMGHARVGNVEANFRCIGGIDSEPAAIADFEMMTGTKGTVMDLFTRKQYEAWHGHPPPEGWREATPDDIRNAAGGEFPNVVFTSPPCKGLTGLLDSVKRQSVKYNALNELTLRGVHLCLEAWKDDLPEFFLLENVPFIMTRGRELLDQIFALLEAYGYRVAETTHDCGELAGLGQSRRRFLMVARNEAKVPPSLFEPQIKPLKSIGDILQHLPMPGDESAGAMHRIPNLELQTWMRLALVDAGEDWRCLQNLTVEDGYLKDFALLPEREWQKTVLGVRHWSETSGTIAGRSTATNGAYSVADPRMDWGNVPDTTNAFKIIELSGALPGDGKKIADPRPDFLKSGSRSHFNTSRHYGVMRWDQHSYVITSKGKYDNGPYSVADPRPPIMNDAKHPSGKNKGQYFIKAMDGTWHRPLTTLEAAALQGLFDPEEFMHLYGQKHSDSCRFVLDGKSDTKWRERIGNAVPPPTAAAIASVMGQAILLARSGETFVLNHMPVWVQPVAMAVSVAGRHEMYQ